MLYPPPAGTILGGSAGHPGERGRPARPESATQDRPSPLPFVSLVTFCSKPRNRRQATPDGLYTLYPPMCGIAGFVGNGSLRVLQGMTRALAHRGPDDENYRQDPPVHLGFRRLSVIDLAGGRQPMTTPDGRHAIVFNGEIYNHAELRRELEGLGRNFSSDHSDTETLLQGFLAWGPAVLERV